MRFATQAPDGTAWARLMHQMVRDAQSGSRGELTIKMYFGGIAGNELETYERLRRGQLDAVMSGGMLCMKLSPSMRVLRLFGLYQSRDEASYVMGRLRPTIDKEFAEAGFHNLGEASLGWEILFSRTPITNLAELKRAKLWFWDLDESLRRQLAALGVPAVGLSLSDAGPAYDEHRIDGFISVPTAALALQWSAKTKYLTELHVGFLPGCVMMTHAAYDSLSNDARRALGEAVGQFQARLEELGRSQDAELLGGLFARQGMKILPASDAFAREFSAAARGAREAVRDKLIPGQLIDRIVDWLGDYRAESASHSPSQPSRK